MFNLRTTLVCLGHIGVEIKRWVPLTSNLLKWKSKLCFHLDFQDNFLCQSICCFPQLAQFGLEWLEFFSLLVSIPFLTVHRDPMCFLLGECVGFSPNRKWQHLPSLQGLCGTFHTSYSGTAGVCVVCPEQHFACPGVGLYNFKGCLDFLHLVDYSLDPA